MVGKEAQKIIIAGLDNAGKSSIIQRVFFNTNVEELEDLKPTKRIDQEEIKIGQEQENQFVFWELGGQSQYIDEYTSSAKIFFETEMIIFVIDLQDPNRYDVAMNYLKELLQYLREVSSAAHVAVILHKFDPDKASELRSNQFTVHRKIKDLRSQFDQLEFSSYSTTVYDDTLYYTFQKLFEKIGIDIGLYKTQIRNQFSLKSEPEPESEEVVKDDDREIVHEKQNLIDQLIDDFESINESASTGSDLISEQISDENKGLERLHEVFEINCKNFHEYESIERKRQAADLSLLSYMEYMASLALKSLKSGKIEAEQGRLIYYFLGQLNFTKIKFIHFLGNTTPRQISSPVKFMEEFKYLTNELLDASYIVGNISLDQLQKLKRLLNGIENPNFSLFEYRTHDVYTFNKIQELKSVFTQDKFVPSDIIDKIELAESLRDNYSDQLEKIMEQADVLSQEDIDMLEIFELRLDHLILQFYDFIEEFEIRSYNVDRVMSDNFNQISNKILFSAHITNIFGQEERLKVKNILETIR